MKAITAIKNFAEGESIQGFYLCLEKNYRQTRKGGIYIDIVLRDRTGSIGCKIWNKVEELGNKFCQSDPVAVSGVVEKFQDRLQLVIRKINRASMQYYARYGYDPSLITPTSESDPKDMWQLVSDQISRLTNKHLHKLVKSIYIKYKDRLLIMPASMLLHHNYRSGYLEHLVSMMKIGNFLAQHYKVDKDLLLTGILLHDIGKVKELEGEFENKYSDEGNFIGHIVLGYDMVRAAIDHFGNFPDDLRLKIEHMILSHQGQPEWGSPKKPVLREALLLHMIDNMDAKFHMMEKILTDDQNDGNWTDMKNYFRTPFFKGKNASD